MKLFAAFACSFTLLAALAGCSSDDPASTPGPDGGSSNPDGGGGNVVEQPGGHSIWTKTTNIAHYQVFPDRAAAIAWFNGADVLRGESGQPTDTAVAAGDARYAAVDAKVAEVYAGFQTAFAADTADLPVPIVILVESASPGAYAVFDPALGLSPNVFMIQTPTLALGDDAVRGVIAHELAHHVFKHKWPDVEDKIERWYDATKVTKSGFGFEQTNDATMKKDIGDPAQLYGTSTGDYPLAAWNGFARPGGTLQPFVRYIHDRAAETNAGPCSESESAHDALLEFADPLRSRVTSTLAPTTDQAAQIDTLAKAWVTKETACTSVVQGSFFAVIGEALGLTEEQARASALPDEIEANDAASSAFDALVRLTQKYDSAMLAMDLENVRYYSYEEQADDTAVAVLHGLGLNAGGLATFFEQGLFTAAQRSECTSLAAAGEPAYGVISDPHHSTCWRIWHAKKVEAFVAQ